MGKICQLFLAKPFFYILNVCLVSNLMEWPNCAKVCTNGNRAMIGQCNWIMCNTAHGFCLLQFMDALAEIRVI